MTLRKMRCISARAPHPPMPCGENGWARDTRGILALDLPCFSFGRYAQDQRPRGKVIDFRCPLRIGAVEVQPGDIIFGDLDGVVVVPKEMEVEVFARARQKSQGEK